MTGFIIGVAVGVIGTVIVVLVYACCKASGEADRTAIIMEDELAEKIGNEAVRRHDLNLLVADLLTLEEMCELARNTRYAKIPVIEHGKYSELKKTDRVEWLGKHAKTYRKRKKNMKRMENRDGK